MLRVDGGSAVQKVQNDPPKEVAPKPLPSPPSENTATSAHVKKHELAVTGAVMAAKVNGRETAPPPPAIPSVQTTGSGTETTYRVGSPTRPNIRHDNGFRQNPNDPNDPNPIPTVSPSMRDRLFRASELAQADGANLLEGVRIPFTDRDNNARPRRLEDGIDAYRHFLTGNGADRTFSYDEYVSEDQSGRATLNNAISDTQRGAEQLYNQIIARDPSLAGKPITFNVTSGAIGVGSSNKYAYPETENWQKAIGGHSIWNSATVTVTPPATAGGKPQFSMNYTLHAEDRYNFNPGQADIATGAPDATRGRLEQVGLAHQYMNYATLNRDVSWTAGQINTSTSVTSGGR